MESLASMELIRVLVVSTAFAEMMNFFFFCNNDINETVEFIGEIYIAYRTEKGLKMLVLT